MTDTRALQSAIDAARSAATAMNEAWCASGRVEQAERLQTAEQELVSALRTIRQVRTPIIQERLAA